MNESCSASIKRSTCTAQFFFVAGTSLSLVAAVIERKKKTFCLENVAKRDENSYLVEKFEQTPSLRTCEIP